MQRIINILANQKWPKYYQASSGLLQFPCSLGHLKPEIADVPAARADDPHVQFFMDRNPTYREGSELVCLAPISLENTKSIGRRNPHNVVKATIVALEMLRDRNTVAEMRGLAVEKL